jgi:hypothetical protein
MAHLGWRNSNRCLGVRRCAVWLVTTCVPRRVGVALLGYRANDQNQLRRTRQI